VGRLTLAKDQKNLLIEAFVLLFKEQKKFD
jgi:hypothetical protein